MKWLTSLPWAGLGLFVAFLGNPEIPIAVTIITIVLCFVIAGHRYWTWRHWVPADKRQNNGGDENA